MDLTEYFGISVPQASLDIAKYTELAPNNLTYDRSSKTYTAAPSFRPLYQRSSAQRYLAELLATKMGWLSQLPALSDPRRRQIGLLPGAPSTSRLSNWWFVQYGSRKLFESVTVHDVLERKSIRLLSPHIAWLMAFVGTCARFATSASVSAISSSLDPSASMV